MFFFKNIIQYILAILLKTYDEITVCVLCDGLSKMISLMANIISDNFLQCYMTYKSRILELNVLYTGSTYFMGIK